MLKDFAEKSFKGIEDDLQPHQSLKIFAYFWKFDHFAVSIVLYQSAFTVMVDDVAYLVIQ